MAERFFKKEVQKLYLGAGQEFRGEGILAVTKALLRSGVSCVAVASDALANLPPGGSL
ncbi:MAG TPA: hypothetical protein VFF39_07205 [Verrucomicrobiae bacterium]|jgi:indolepyruvate ferredoxin oxidoreductase alpha subunit|nr:hypothetical protein [Verrucomicrobiae bacterium]